MGGYTMNKHTGFTLIEVLIAVLVLAIGLLGLAAVQATSLRNNLSAYNRSQATELAYDMADRMRANIAGSATYAANTAVAKPDCLDTTGCPPADMASNDRAEWNTAVAALPSGTGTMATANGIVTITIRWDDNRSGDITDADPTFQTRCRL
jgi:type IV pilus assembly protein PilV